MDALPTELLSLVHDLVDLSGLLRLGATSRRLRAAKGAGRVFVVTVAVNKWYGSYYSRFDTDYRPEEVDQHMQMFSSLGKAMFALRALRKSTSKMFHIEPAYYYRHSLPSGGPDLSRPILCTGPLASCWKPVTSHNVTTWTTWSHGGDPTESQDAGHRMTIKLTISKVDRSPKALLVSLKSSRVYRDAVGDALEAESNYHGQGYSREDYERDKAEYLSVDV